LASLAWLQVTRLLIAGRVALLHVHMASGANSRRKSLFIIEARISRMPYVLHMHGGGFLDFYRSACGPLRRVSVRATLRSSRAVIALSEQWRQVFAEFAAGCRCIVIANPFETAA
jgi:hypothetical protein